MAGPVACVLTPSPLPKTEVAARLAELGCVPSDRSDDEFMLEGEPFFWWVGPEFPEDLSEPINNGLPAVLGWTPCDMVSFGAFCNGLFDHKLLARLCLAFAEATGGIVSFNGAMAFGPTLSNANKDAAVRVVHPKGLTGVLYATSYQTASDEYGTNHYGDASLLRSWMAQPDFYMVK